MKDVTEWPSLCRWARTGFVNFVKVGGTGITLESNIVCLSGRIQSIFCIFPRWADASRKSPLVNQAPFVDTFSADCSVSICNFLYSPCSLRAFIFKIILCDPSFFGLTNNYRRNYLSWFKIWFCNKKILVDLKKKITIDSSVYFNMV